jgi:hypothetical protein
MKKLLIALLIAPVLFTACQGDDKPERDPVKDSLVNKTEDLNSQVTSKDAALDSFFRAFNDIQANLDEIKQKEKLISKDTLGGDVRGREAKIKADIQSIYNLMLENKQKLATARRNLKKNDVKIASLEATIAHLDSTLASRETEIVALKDQLEKMNVELANLSMNYEESQSQSAAKTEQLNTAYYAYGTSKALKENGVITKEGGFAGIGKTSKVSTQMNMDYFTKIDVTQTKEITLGAKKAKVVSTHPAGTYQIQGADGRADKIVITDPEKFWSVSKYLVVVVE